MPAQKAYQKYQTIRHRLPACTSRHNPPRELDTLLDIAEQYDTFLFDAYGVLNVGSTAIPGAAAVIAELQRRGKNCLVVSNAASFDKPFYCEKYRKLGFSFSAENIITSRDALLAGLQNYPADYLWGRIGPANDQGDLERLGIRTVDQDAPDFLDADGFLFFSPLRWDDARQAAFTASLDARPRPILLGNPDLIAPLGGTSSIEAGSYVLLLEDQHFTNTAVFGKPFPAIYDIAAARLQAQGKMLEHGRTLMLGDTLHTDILGGNAYGVKTALIYGHGFFNGLDWRRYIKDSGIMPDYAIAQI